MTIGDRGLIERLREHARARAKAEPGLPNYPHLHIAWQAADRLERVLRELDDAKMKLNRAKRLGVVPGMFR